MARIVSLLFAIASIVQQLIRYLERRRVAKKEADNAEELRKIDEDPSGWMRDHFSGAAAVDGVQSDAGSASDLAAAKTQLDGAAEPAGRDVPGP